MIDISGDIIYFDNRPVGFVIIPAGTMRDRFEDALLGIEATRDEREEFRSEISGLEDECEELESERETLETKINRALRYAEDESEPDWQKLIEILS